MVVHEESEYGNVNDLRVVYVEPEAYPREITIPHTLKQMQQLVGGYIEAYPLDDGLYIICNEDGKNIGLPLNRAVKDHVGRVEEIIAGPFFVCSAGYEDFESLNDDQVKKITERFRYPEKFFRLGDEVIAVPHKPAKEKQLDK